MVLHHLSGNGSLFTQNLQLNQEALSQVSGRNTRWVKRLHNLESLADVFDGVVASGSDLVHRRRQIAILVEIANDGDSRILNVGLSDREVQLPLQMVAQRGCLCEEALKARTFNVFARHLRAVARIEVIVEITTVVDLLKWICRLPVGRLVH